MISTGTWVIIMAVGGTARLDPEADMLANVDVRGEPVPTARFMGGREYSVLAGDAPADADEADIAAIIASGALALPAFSDQGGPFAARKGVIEGKAPTTPKARAALATLYSALDDRPYASPPRSAGRTHRRRRIHPLAGIRRRARPPHAGPAGCDRADERRRGSRRGDARPLGRASFAAAARAGARGGTCPASRPTGTGGSRRFKQAPPRSAPSCNLPAPISFHIVNNSGEMKRGRNVSDIHAWVGEVSTLIPARLERLPWGRFHVLVIAALGITWILDGLEVTLAGSVAPALKDSPALRFSDSEVGLAGSAYLLGAVVGALFFGWLTDRLGRKKLFFITIVVYLIATALTGLAWNGFAFFLFRFFTGCGIGGEYSAINSTIQELVPARYRGQLDLTINGSFWVGAALGAVVAVVLLNPALIPAEWGWRLAFLTGAILGLAVFFMRMWVPESPRWLAIHGREKEGEDVVKGIEQRFEDEGVKLDPVPADKSIRLRSRAHTPLSEVFDTLINRHRVQTFVGLTLMAAQAFFYNAIFFTYALVLTKFYSVGPGSVGWYILPFALSNFLGPVILGRLFDTLGRRIMITLTYGLSGVLMLAVAVAFQQDLLSAMGQTIGWMIVFFIASPAASAAYLTVSETFPIEIRAMTIAIFYAIGTGVGGVAAPLIFGKLIESGSRQAASSAAMFSPLVSCSPPPSSPGCTPSTPSASRSNRWRRRCRRWGKETCFQRDANRCFAASVTGVYIPTSVPSGSRNCAARFPHGIIFGSCTTSTLSFRRANSASTSSTWNSMIAVRLAAGSALPSLNRATVSALPKASVAEGVTISANTGASHSARLSGHHFVEADHRLDVSGDEPRGSEFHER